MTLLLRTLALTASLLLISFVAFADDDEMEGPPADNSANKIVLTLDECVESALKNDKKLAAQRHRLVALEEGKSAALWAPFSNFFLEGKFTVVPDKCSELTAAGRLQECGGGTIPDENFFRTSDWGPSFHLKFKGAIPIPTSRKMFAGKKALEEEILAKKAMVPVTDHEIRYNVHRAFHAVTGAREMRYTLSEGRKQLEKARKKIEENLENQEGTETEIDLVKLKVFEAQLDAMEQEAIQIEKQGLAAIRFLVQPPRGKVVDIPNDPQELVDSNLKPLDTYLKEALNHRPELEALRHAIGAHEAVVDFHRSELIPDVAFVIGLKWGYTPGVEFRQNGGTVTDPDYSDDVPWLYRNNYNYKTIVPGMALVMSYPLNFGVDVHKIRQAKAELSAMVMEKKYALEGIMLQVETAYIELESIKAAIQALNKSRRLAKGWLAAAVQNHAAGIGPSKDVKDALKEYFAIMAQLHQKIAAYNMGLAKLAQATGHYKIEKNE